MLQGSGVLANDVNARRRDPGELIMPSSSEQLVKMVIAHHLDKATDEIEVTHSLRRDLGFDSLSLVGIALELEDVQEAEFPIERLEHIDTVSDLIVLTAGVVPAPPTAWRAATTRLERRDLPLS